MHFWCLYQLSLSKENSFDSLWLCPPLTNWFSSFTPTLQHRLLRSCHWWSMSKNDLCCSMSMLWISIFMFKETFPFEYLFRLMENILVGDLNQFSRAKSLILFSELSVKLRIKIFFYGKNQNLFKQLFLWFYGISKKLIYFMSSHNKFKGASMRIYSLLRDDFDKEKFERKL